MVILAGTVIPAAAEPVKGFHKTETYHSGRFSDVKPSDWFVSNVQMVYEYGIMNGISSEEFSPEGSLTVVEAITMAVRLNSIYNGNGDILTSSAEPWYQDYVDYADQHGMLDINAFSWKYSEPVKRSDFAVILTSALPAGELGKINEIYDYSLPDVSGNSDYY